MLMSLLGKLEKIRIAEGREEKDALARFAYRVYVEELGYAPPGVDHARKMVRDAHDLSPDAIHLYAGTLDDLKGTMRLLCWAPGEVEPGFYEAYSMRLFPGLERLRTAEIGRLMIDPRARGRLILPSLASKAYELLADEVGADLAFAECRPGLVEVYRRLGMRPYCADLIRTPEGLMVPLVDVLSDLDYQRSVHSITLSAAQRIFGPRGGRPPLDTTPFAALFDEDNQRIEVGSEQIWSTIQGDIARHRPMPSIFTNISPKEQRLIIDGGVILDLKEGVNAAVEGRAEVELYIVLEGSFHVLIGEQIIAQLGAGEVFGEMAFFRDSSTRSATVRAAEDSKMLILRRSFLQKLKKKHPEVACTILFNLGRTLSERLARQNLAH